MFRKTIWFSKSWITIHRYEDLTFLSFYFQILNDICWSVMKYVLRCKYQIKPKTITWGKMFQPIQTAMKEKLAESSKTLTSHSGTSKTGWTCNWLYGAGLPHKRLNPFSETAWENGKFYLWEVFGLHGTKSAQFACSPMRWLVHFAIQAGQNLAQKSKHSSSKCIKV